MKKTLIVSIEMFQSGDVPEAVKQFIVKYKDPFIILDESSKIKTNQAMAERKKSKRCQAVKKLNTIGERAIATGTFMSISPVNAFDQMEFLKKGYFPEGMYAFQERYVVMQTIPVGRGTRVKVNEKTYKSLHKRLVKAQKNNELDIAMSAIFLSYKISEESQYHILMHEEYTPYKHLDELINRIKDDCMIIHTDPKDNHRVYIEHKVELSPAQKKLYKELYNTSMTEDIECDNGMSLYHRFQDICNGFNPKQAEGEEEVTLEPLKQNPKLDMLIEQIEQIGNHQIVIWCSRVPFRNVIIDYLKKEKITFADYTESNDQAYRDSLQKKVENKEVQIFLANPVNAGFGLDYLKDIDYAIYVCNSASVEARDQSEKRIHRGIVKHSKFIIDIFMEKTVEEKVLKGLKLGEELVTAGKTDMRIFELED